MVTSTYAKQSTVQGLVQVRGHRGGVQYRQSVSGGPREGPSETEPDLPEPLVYHECLYHLASLLI